MLFLCWKETAWWIE